MLPRCDWLARIICTLEPMEQETMLAGLNLKMLAKVLLRLHADEQEQVLEDLSDQKVIGVIPEMTQQAAASLLRRIPPMRRQRLLAEMESKQASDLGERLAHLKGPADAITRLDMTVVSPQLTAEQVTTLLKEMPPSKRSLHNLCVAGEDQTLLGMFTVGDLIRSDPSNPVLQLMHRPLISVGWNAPLKKIVQRLVRYKLAEVPVVDRTGHLQGVIIIRDVVTLLKPNVEN